MDKMDTSFVWQIGVVVKDVAATSKRIQELFGFEKACPVNRSGKSVYDGADVHYMGKPVDGDFDGCFYDFGSVQIEFMSPADDGPSVWRDFLNTHGEGIHHIAWKVADTDKTQKYLESKGLKMQQRGNWPNGTYAYFDGLDFMGVILETLEFNDERKAGDSLITKWYERRHD